MEDEAPNGPYAATIESDGPRFRTSSTTPMMVVLGIGELRVRVGDRFEWFAIGEGFLHVADDVVTVLTPFAEAAREVDVEAARRLEITAAENPLLQGTILGEEQRKRLAKLRERVAARAR